MNADENKSRRIVQFLIRVNLLHLLHQRPCFVARHKVMNFEFEAIKPPMHADARR
jgi:hypothetical protein